MKNRILLLFISVFSILQLYGQGNRLRVVDPDRTWRNAPALIKDVILTVDTRGAFFEYGLYMTIEDTESNSSFGEQLEVVLDFTLPAEASVIDSWLWVEGEIIQADLLDRWTANQIYEDIVDRRQDPSILFKQSATQYQLRIYPLFRGGERRVKIAWMQPLQWGDKTGVADLPTQILGASTISPNITMRVFPKDGWSNPSLEWAGQSSFTAGSEEELGGDYLELSNLSWSEYSLAQLRIDAPFEDGLLLTTSETEGAQYYQMVYQPTIPAENLPNRRQLILLDYQSGNSTVTREEMLNSLRSALQLSLAESDEFNLILPQFPFAPVSEDWITASSANIDALFDDLGTADVSAVSNLPILLERGLTYAGEQADPVNVTLVSNSSNFTTLSAANALFDQIRPLFIDTETRISIAYFINGAGPSMFANGRWYFGNEYLFELMARQSDGLFNMRNFNDAITLREDLQMGLSLGPNVFGGFDLRTRMTNGFCYNRFELNTSSLLSDYPTFVEIGQFVGEPPFRAEFLGVLNDNIFEVVNEINVPQQNRQAFRAFTGMDIKANENLAQTNTVISGIIDQSLAARVLSKYTAFLALEPNQGGVVCDDCVDGSSGGDGSGIGGDGQGSEGEGEDDDDNPVATDDLTANSLVKVVVMPNPIQQQANINITTKAGLSRQSVLCRVVDINGKVLHAFPTLEISADQTYTLSWDASDLPSGIYIVQLITEEGMNSLKVLKM